LRGLIKGDFPAFLHKTDQERVQNLTREYKKWTEEDTLWEVTEKLDGSSMTVYINDDLTPTDAGVFRVEGVCSRNLDLKETESNAFWAITRKLCLIEKMRETLGGIALQGEMVGPGIQQNKYGLTEVDFFVFDIYDIKTGQYWLPRERRGFCTLAGIKHVPVLNLEMYLPKTIQEVLKYAEDKSALSHKTEREGVVFKNVKNQASFKVISNKFLTRQPIDADEDSEL
jgi:RNA ligase (TIGR02306 family)